MLSADDYLALVTSEHRQRPNFAAAVRALADGPASISNVLEALPPKFDLDTAVGVQLDAVGEWVGISRRITIPLQGVYFEWDTEAVLGWGLGSWQGPDDPSTGLVVLDDASYRTLIRAKIAANQWDGTVPEAIAAYALVFPEQEVIIQDNQDMTMDVIFLGPPLSAVERALILGDLLVLRPATVQIHVYSLRPIVPIEPELEWDTDAEHGWGPGKWVPRYLEWDTDAEHGWGLGAEWKDEIGDIFAWDTESAYFSGWGTGSFIGPLLPTT